MYCQLVSSLVLPVCKLDLYCQLVSLILPVCKLVLCAAWNLHTKYQHVTSPITSELAMDDIERQLQRQQEQESARRESETAEQREERLRKWRTRDRAMHAAQTVTYVFSKDLREKGQATEDEYLPA